MDFKKLGQQVGKLKQQAEEKLGDRAEPENLKRDAKELRGILAGDGSLADKAKEAKEKVVDRDKAAEPGKPAGESPVGGEAAGGAETEVVPDSAGTGKNEPDTANEPGAGS